jgi:hypothetical protein
LGSKVRAASPTLNFDKKGRDVLIRKIYEALRPRGHFVGFQDRMTR